MSLKNLQLLKIFKRGRFCILYKKVQLCGGVCHKSSLAYVWGASDAGQLGRISVANHTPFKFPIDTEVSHIGCGNGFTVVSEKTGSKLWMSGLNTSYQCGNAFSDVILEPYQVDLPVKDLTTSIKQISCGRSHTMVLTDNEGVFALGGNTQGQCGTGDKGILHIKDFQSIKLPDENGEITKVVCGLDHTLFLSETGKLFACGWGADGQTGQDHFHDEPCINQVKGELDDVVVKEIASSADCCLAVSNNGEVFSWGNSEYNQLGLDTQEQQVSIATKATLLCELGMVKLVGAAGSFCVLVTEESAVYSWGYGVLGCGPGITSSKLPQRIKAFDGINDQITQMHCGLDHVAIVTEAGRLFTWGRGSFGRLGIRHMQDQWTPTHVQLPGNVKEVSCGVDHMGVILETQEDN